MMLGKIDVTHGLSQAENEQQVTERPTTRDTDRFAAVGRPGQALFKDSSTLGAHTTTGLRGV